MESKDKRFCFCCFILLMAVIFSIMTARRPDIIFNAQPWAEDGKIWLAGVYNNGFLSSLLLPQNGYYQTISRLTYGISLLFGIENSPLVSNVIAILIRVSFCAFILSSRMAFAPILYRSLAVGYLVLMPNLQEGYVNITNIHWYLSMYLLAIIMAERSDSLGWKIHDFSILIVSSLSGPFVIFIAPCLIIKRIYERGGFINAIKRIDSFDIVMAACCVIQVIAILSSPEGARSPAPLGASLGVLMKVISYRIVAGTFFSNEYVSFITKYDYACLAIFLLTALPISYYFLRSGWRFKIAFIFPVLMLGFALAKPMISLSHPQWPQLFGTENGQRYFFVTNFAFFSFVLFTAYQFKRFEIFIIPCITLFTLFTLLKSFTMLPLPNSGFKEDIDKFKALPNGQSMDVKINPPSWTMHLIKNN